MAKIHLVKPVLIYMYGYPGSGKSYLARNLVETVQMANVSADKLRSELFEHPRFDAQENAIITHLMNYLAEEFLAAGVSVIYDTNSLRLAQRRKLRDLARKHKAEHLLVWLQIDPEGAYMRTQGRDRRTTEGKYAEQMTRLNFDRHVAGMQNPKDEDYLVISGKHAFLTQKGAILSRLYQMGLVGSETVQGNVKKPELVNLIPNPHAGRVDFSRRNITIT
jgi:predicted kinase